MDRSVAASLLLRDATLREAQALQDYHAALQRARADKQRITTALEQGTPLPDVASDFTVYCELEVIHADAVLEIGENEDLR